MIEKHIKDRIYAKYSTHCPFCSYQCAIWVVQDSHGFRVEPREFATNKGEICIKGWHAAALIEHPKRVLNPLIRSKKDNAFRASNWEEAISFTVEKLSQIRSQWGNSSIFVYGSGSLTNEKAYLLGKFARVALQSSAIDYNGRYCMASASKALEMALGIDRGLPFPIDYIAHTDLLLLVGTNPLETMPPIRTHFDCLKKRNKKIIAIDPRPTPTTTYADVHLQIKPGTDGILANGLLYLLIQKNKIDHYFIRNYTYGFEKIPNSVSSFWPAKVETLTGISQRELLRVAELLETEKNIVILTGRGCEQQTQGVFNVLSFINLALALGIVGKVNSGFGTLTGQGNGQGAREFGLKPDQLPGARSNLDSFDRNYIARLWQIDEKDLPSSDKSVTEIFDSLAKPQGIKAMLVFGANPIVSSPNNSKLKRLFPQLEFLLVCDSFLSETAAMADVVLPTAIWAEETGTVTNLEGRVLLRPKILDPPKNVKTDLEIIHLLAEKFGYGVRFSSDPQAIFEELRRATAGAAADYSAITYQRLSRGEELYWPCHSFLSKGQKDIFLSKRFPTDKGKAKFHPVYPIAFPEEPNSEYPFYLTTGRTLYHYQTGVQTRLIQKLQEKEPSVIVEINPAVARHFGIKDGQYVLVETKRGKGYFKAKFSPNLRLDTLFIPFYSNGQVEANALTLSLFDPLSKMPSFKLCAAKIQSPTEQTTHTEIRKEKK